LISDDKGDRKNGVCRQDNHTAFPNLPTTPIDVYKDLYDNLPIGDKTIDEVLKIEADSRNNDKDN